MQVVIPNTKSVPLPYKPWPLAADELPLWDVPVPIAPPVPVGVWPLGRFEGRRLDPKVRVVGFETAVAEGILFLPLGMARMLLAVWLNFAGAREISWLSCRC
jgi:hypothetical protein